MPLTIELPSIEGQAAFNLRRWHEVLADSSLTKLPYRIETDRHGHIVMSPPPAFHHSQRQGKIVGLMLALLPEGQALPECPLSTSDGVKAIDVAWLSARREENVLEPTVLERAPKSVWKLSRLRTRCPKSRRSRRFISRQARGKSGPAVWIAS
jgi:hypothetical protein